MLKLEDPAKRTRDAVAHWITGTDSTTQTSDPSAAKSPSTDDVEQGPQVTHENAIDRPKMQFLKDSAMHTLYAEGAAHDMVALGQVAGEDLLTRWVAKWRALNIFRVRRPASPRPKYVTD